MGGWGCSRGREGGGGVSSVAPSSWLKDVQVLALLLMTVIKRLEVIGMPGAGGGGRSARSSGALGASPGTRDAAHLAWAAWYWAALAFAFALAALPRRRWRRLPEAGAAGFDGEGVVEVEEASLSSMTSLAMVALPPLEERVKVADLPAFCMRWYTSNREASSSPIFCSDSEQMKAMRSSRNLVLSLSLPISSIAYLINLKNNSTFLFIYLSHWRQIILLNFMMIMMSFLDNLGGNFDSMDIVGILELLVEV